METTNKRKLENNNDILPKKRKIVIASNSPSKPVKNRPKPKYKIRKNNQYLNLINNGFYHQIVKYDNFHIASITKAKLLFKLFKCPDINIIEHVFNHSIDTIPIKPLMLFNLTMILMKSNQIDKILFLLERNIIDVNYTNNKQNTILHMACFNSRLEMAKIFLDYGCPIEEQNLSGQTALHIACERKSVKLVQMLMDAGANPNIKENIYYLTPIFTICRAENCLDIIKVLVDKIDLTEVNNNNQTFFHLLCGNSDITAVKYFADRVKNLEDLDKQNMTPIHMATLNDRLQTVEFLAERNVNINCKNILGNTPLHLAVNDGRLNVAKLLIKKGANINCSNHLGLTPLHVACKKNSYNMVKLLLESGANPDIVEHTYNVTPIFYIPHDNLDVFSLIIWRVSDVNHTNFLNQTLLHLACVSGSIEIVKYLVNIGANIELLDANCNSPLDLAFYQKHFEIVKTLLEKKV